MSCGVFGERNARHFEDVEMLVLELCRNMLRPRLVHGVDLWNRMTIP
jgi:hypothetical protein